MPIEKIRYPLNYPNSVDNVAFEHLHDVDEVVVETGLVMEFVLGRIEIA